MRRRLVVLPAMKQLIHESPGFVKKDLSDHKLDVLALCEFGCRYCSSTTGYYLRVHREEFAAITEQQLGERVLPADDPTLMFGFDSVVENLERELRRHRKGWGTGLTLMYSMLTDGFSPYLVSSGTTRAVLEAMPQPLLKV